VQKQGKREKYSVITKEKFIIMHLCHSDIGLVVKPAGTKTVYCKPENNSSDKYYVQEFL